MVLTSYMALTNLFDMLCIEDDVVHRPLCQHYEGALLVGKELGIEKVQQVLKVLVKPGRAPQQPHGLPL